MNSESGLDRRSFLLTMAGLASTVSFPLLKAFAASQAGFRMVDVTSSAGLNFKHNSGAFGGKFLPETLGSGCAFLDYDGDGWQDILLINGADWPGHRRERSTLKLYRNNRNGTFTDVTRSAGLDIEMYGMGVALVVVFVLWGVVVYLLPDSIGEALLKRSWHPAHDVIPAYTAVMAASGMLTAATVGLRAMAAAKRSLRSRLVTGVLAVAGGTVGAATAGAVGAATGLAAGLWIGGIQWWQQLAMAIAEEEDRRAAEGVVAAADVGPATAKP